MKTITAFFQFFTRNAGSVAPMFAMLAPLLFTALGGAIDVSNSYLIKQRLIRALDAATLAATASGKGEEDIKAKVKKFVNLNFPPDKIGKVYDIDTKLNGDKVEASASVDFDTYFLHLMNLDTISINARSVVKREVRGIEVVLVLDVTGSMADEIEELETSVTNFINRICEGLKCGTNVKIGFVPFSTSVNVGPYGLGLDEDGKDYGDAFVNNPYNKAWSLDQSKLDDWSGCILETKINDTNLEYEGNWDMYRNPYSYVKKSEYFDYESYSHYNEDDNKHYYHRYNYYCNNSYITPLTNDKDRLLSKISFKAQGRTLGNIGMLWGLRTLLPDAPFTEAAPWTDTTTQRVIIVMTDGKNSIPGNGTSATSYSAYGPTTDDGVNINYLDDQFAALCEQAKDEYGVNVYTITFSSGVDQDTEELFEACASTPSNYYDVDEAEDLAGAYEKIARELSNLHISQ